MSLKDDCKCGHDRTHHYRDPNTGDYCNCLAMRCECRWFKDPEKPDPPVPEWAQPKSNWDLFPHSPPEDKAPETEPTPWWPTWGFAPRPPTKAKPHADTACNCTKCKEWTAKRWGGRPSP